MKQYLEIVFDIFVIVTTSIAIIVSFVGLLMLLVGDNKIELWIEVLLVLYAILGGSYIIYQHTIE